MANTDVKELMDAGVHFGHLTRKWNPNMAPYIYMERNGIHIISLYKTVAKIEEASEAMKKIAASGRKILFVATKKQAKDWAEFSSAVGLKELDKLAKDGINLHLPVPGGVIENGKLYANSAFAYLSIEYSLDNGQSWQTYAEPVKVDSNAKVTLRTRLNAQQASRATVVGE